ncbi:glycerophosphodiester phosphodiesterase family protein [Hyphomicrobium sp.]|jgi:glycerophosphoryl diester phosphodiesterase|uniref:glycerophosphodiester phosphodiesterase family protein n=1 Tax=Hyphomicrobium sp. TaxID=82 RepID=UPI002C5DB477|nr:glycerophosphodiester phosphodiesterase family protein [Hyphomicrobium sp.]HVZ04585.1 glycerophosphodiester phosphodiesterase family protein [Hyphomicrobium sp.]
MFDRAAFLRPVAHRGLHDARRALIENTGPAFEAAIAKSYGIECDVRPAAGGLPIVFHDETLERLVKGRGPVATIAERDLKVLRHRVGGAPILTFVELLDLVRGRTPLLIEIKSEWEPPQESFLSKIAAAASAYKGPLALMSFDPAVMIAIKVLAPDVPRGIVSGSYRGSGWWSRCIGRKRAASLRDLLESGSVAPDFYAYDVNALPTPVTEYARKVQGLPLFTWTVRTAKQRKIAANWADAMIFEGFEP